MISMCNQWVLGGGILLARMLCLYACVMTSKYIKFLCNKIKRWLQAKLSIPINFITSCQRNVNVCRMRIPVFYDVFFRVFGFLGERWNKKA